MTNRLAFKRCCPPHAPCGGLAHGAGLASGIYGVTSRFAQQNCPLAARRQPRFRLWLAEDLTNRISITTRLVATTASGVLAWVLTGYALTGVDVWGVDWLLQFTAVAVVFTAFAVGGVANAINIIDGPRQQHGAVGLAGHCQPGNGGAVFCVRLGQGI